MLLLRFSAFYCLYRWYSKIVFAATDKKDNVAIIVISTFLIVLLSFILIIIINPSYLNVDITITTSVAFVFLLIVFRVFFVKWYNDKHKKIINIGRVIIALSLTLFGAVFLVLKFGGNKEKKYYTNRSFKYHYN